MSDFWVFGYGSLMWNPGFTHETAEQAVLHGAHRSLCVYSWFHRGTQERPGLVFGLDHGGACRGMAFKVSASERHETIAYLRKREQNTMVYRETWRKVRLISGENVTALTFVVDRSHPQYAGSLPLAEQLNIVSGAVGQSGKNPEYVLNTASHMRDAGIQDYKIHWLASRLKS